MSEIFNKIQEKGIQMPHEVLDLIKGAKSVNLYERVEDLALAAAGGEGSNLFEVKYEISGKGWITEAIVHRTSNGISVNYPEPYMRRRDPDTMVIADDLPTDKPRFS